MLSGSPSHDEHLLTVWQPCCSCGDGPNTFRPSNHPEQTDEINNKLQAIIIILTDLMTPVHLEENAK
jgi:hypothetical protein